MAQKPRPAENVVPLFDEDPYDVEELAVGRSLRQPVPVPPAPGTVIDLTGKTKLVAVFGAGGTGKTTGIRYAVESMLTANRSARLVAIDPENRDLPNFFRDVYEPPTSDPAGVVIFLKAFLDALVRDQASGLVDTGGGDTAFGRLVSEIPTLVSDLAAEGITMVAVYMFNPRIADLSVLATMERAGFQPEATALILNEGNLDGGRDADQEFAPLRRHSAFRAAVERGAIELRMPKLAIAKKIENRSLQFRHAVSSKIPEGRKVAPLGWSDRNSLKSWLARMDDAMAPITNAGWLP